MGVGVGMNGQQIECTNSHTAKKMDVVYQLAKRFPKFTVEDCKALFVYSYELEGPNQVGSMVLASGCLDHNGAP